MLGRCHLQLQTTVAFLRPTNKRQAFAAVVHGVKTKKTRAPFCHLDVGCLADSPAAIYLARGKPHTRHEAQPPGRGSRTVGRPSFILQQRPVQLLALDPLCMKTAVLPPAPSSLPLGCLCGRRYSCRQQLAYRHQMYRYLHHLEKGNAYWG